MKTIELNATSMEQAVLLVASYNPAYAISSRIDTHSMIVLTPDGGMIYGFVYSVDGSYIINLAIDDERIPAITPVVPKVSMIQRLNHQYLARVTYRSNYNGNVKSFNIWTIGANAIRETYPTMNILAIQRVDGNH